MKKFDVEKSQQYDIETPVIEYWLIIAKIYCGYLKSRKGPILSFIFALFCIGLIWLYVTGSVIGGVQLR